MNTVKVWKALASGTAVFSDSKGDGEETGDRKMSKWLIMFAGGWVISFTGMKNLRFLFERRRWMAPNYNGDAIPLGYGLVFWIALVWFVFCEPASVWLIGPSIIVSFAGWLDDRIGQSRMKGLRGHFGILWREGRITTGMLKV